MSEIAATSEQLVKQEYNSASPDLGAMIEARRQEINLSLSTTLARLAEKANIMPSLENFRMAFETVRAIPLALYDTLTYFYTKGIEQKCCNLTAEEADLQWTLSMKQAFKYNFHCEIAKRRIKAEGIDPVLATELAHEFAWGTVKTEVRTRHENQLHGRIRARIARQDAVYITQTTIEDYNVFNTTLEEAVIQGKPVTVLEISDQDTPWIKAQVQATLERLYSEYRLDTSNLIEIPHFRLNPYRSVTLARELGRIDPDHAEYVNSLLSHPYGVLNTCVHRLHELFTEVSQTRNLTDGEKRQFVAEVMIMMGMPKEDIRGIFRESREMHRSEDQRKVDIAFMLSRVSQAAAVIHSVSPEAARTFVSTIAELTGANQEAVNYFMQALSNEGVLAAMASGDGSGIKLLAELYPGPLAKILGVPNPISETGQFLDHLAQRVRDIWWITGLNAGFMTLFEGVQIALGNQDLNSAMSEGWRWFLFLESLMPLQTITAVFPGLQRLPLQISIQQIINWAKKLPLTEGFAQGADDWIPAFFKEGLGLGLDPMRFSSMVPKQFNRWSIQGGGTTWVSRTKEPVLLETSGPYKFKVTDKFFNGFATTRTLTVGPSTGELRSNIPDHFLAHTNPITALLGFNRIIKPVRDLHRKYVAVISEVWRAGEIGAGTTSGPSYKDQLIAGFLNLVFSFLAPVFPEAQVHKSVDTTAVALKSAQDTHEASVVVKEIPRRDKYFNSRILGCFSDLASSWLAINLNVMLLSLFPGLRTSLAKAGEFLQTPTQSLGLTLRIPLIGDILPLLFDTLTIGAPELTGRTLQAITADQTLAVHSMIITAVDGIGGKVFQGGRKSTAGDSGTPPGTGGNHLIVQPGATPRADQVFNEIPAGDLAREIMVKVPDALRPAENENFKVANGYRIFRSENNLIIEKTGINASQPISITGWFENP